MDIIFFKVHKLELSQSLIFLFHFMGFCQTVLMLPWYKIQMKYGRIVIITENIIAIIIIN